MRKMVSLENIYQNKALLTDLTEDNKNYEVELSNSELEIYQSLLDEAQAEELEDEETGVYVFYNTDTNKLELTESEL